MPLINKTLPGIWNGVSQQAPELRLDNQVEEMVNCYPTIAHGVTKRPPAVWSYTDDTIGDDAFIYTYDRGAGDEKYIIVIDGGRYRIFDVVLNQWATNWAASSYLDVPAGASTKESFALTTVGDTTFVVNKTVATKMKIGTEGAVGDKYWTLQQLLFLAKGVTNTEIEDLIRGTIYATVTVNGTPYTTSKYYNQIVGFNSTLNFTDDVQTLISNLLSVIDNAEPDITKIDTYTLLDSGVSNVITLSVTATWQYGTTLENNYICHSNMLTDWANAFYYWVKRTSGADASDPTNAPLRHTYYIYKNDVEQCAIVSHDSTDAANQLATAIGGTPRGSVVFKEVASGDKWTGGDSWGDQASESWRAKIKSLQDLPTKLGFDGAVIEVSGDDKNAFDNYYVKYEDGVYKETYRPFIAEGNFLDESTMPHKIGIRRINGVYYGIDDIPSGNFFIEGVWSPRKVGDTESASAPSFVNNYIKDVFFYRNRLGFISGDNIILSEVGVYENFWPTTVTTIIDSDPIDVAVDSNQAVSLKYAIPYNKELLIFGDKTQYVLSGGDTLTPGKVSVQQSTAFEISDVAPVALGPNVYFVTNKTNSSSIREYFVQPNTSVNDAADITAHCPSYIPNGITKLVGSSKYDMLFAITGNDNSIYAYNFYWQGDQKAQSAWHKWTFNDGVFFNIEVLEDELLIMYKENTGSSKHLLKINLEPDQQGLVYQDWDEGVYHPVSSSIELTKWRPQTSGEIKNIRGKLMIKSTMVSSDPGSNYSLIVDNDKRSASRVYLNTASNKDKTYRTTGNTDDLTLTISDATTNGFTINSVNLEGTYTAKSRSI